MFTPPRRKGKRERLGRTIGDELPGGQRINTITMVRFSLSREVYLDTMKRDETPCSRQYGKTVLVKGNKRAWLVGSTGGGMVLFSRLVSLAFNYRGLVTVSEKPMWTNVARWRHVRALSFLYSGCIEISA